MKTTLMTNRQAFRGSMFAALVVSVLAIATTQAAVKVGWWTVDGGGTTFCNGGTYSLGGTTGQSDAGTLTGGNFTLRGGFWAGSGTVSLCLGDANRDGVVDPLDSGFVLARLGCSLADSDCRDANVNGDGVVDPLDVGFVLARFGTCN